MDTSRGIDDANRSLDYVIGRISNPVELGREQLAELFMRINGLIRPYLSKMGLSPLKDVGGALRHKLEAPLEEAGIDGLRLSLAKQQLRSFNSNLADWEVYITEKAHWVIVMSRKRGNGDVRIIKGKEEFLEYYDQMEESGFVHPWHWMVDAPRFVVDRAATMMTARLQILEHLEETLSQIDQRFFLVITSPK